jgi:hypothetical protein
MVLRIQWVVEGSPILDCSIGLDDLAEGHECTLIKESSPVWLDIDAVALGCDKLLDECKAI